MESPLSLLYDWLNDEKQKGNIFPQGAVLATASKEGIPRSRVVTTLLDESNRPKFYSSPASRKFSDIAFNNNASLTYSFQGTLRSISLEGSLSQLNNTELDEDWLKFDSDFRRHYLVFGKNSGSQLSSQLDLRKLRDEQPKGIEDIRPSSFIGYKFSEIKRIAFYMVNECDFATSIVYERQINRMEWKQMILFP